MYYRYMYSTVEPRWHDYLLDGTQLVV